MKLFVVLMAIVHATANAQSFETPTAAGDPYTPVTPAGRVNWVLNSTLGPASMFTMTAESALKTWADKPREYGAHWDGFGKRVASGYATAVVGDTMVASLGAIWGEDPRYRRRAEGSNGARLWYSMKMAFLAEKQSGGVMPAYSRFIAIPASRVISNSWREPTEVTAGGTMLRIGLGFARRAGGNAFNEFWPDVRQRLRSMMGK